MDLKGVLHPSSHQRPRERIKDSDAGVLPAPEIQKKEPFKVRKMDTLDQMRESVVQEGEDPSRHAWSSSRGWVGPWSRHQACLICVCTRGIWLECLLLPFPTQSCCSHPEWTQRREHRPLRESTPCTAGLHHRGQRRCTAQTSHSIPENRATVRIRLPRRNAMRCLGRAVFCAHSEVTSRTGNRDFV